MAERIRKVKRIFEIEQIMFPFDRKFESGYSFSGESHDFWEILFVKDGKLEVTEDENVYWLSGGDIVFHAPGEFHRLKSSGNTQPKAINLSFVARGNVPLELTKGVFALDLVEQKEFAQIFQLANDFVANGEVEGFEGQEAADSLGAFLLRVCRNNESKQQLSSSNRAEAYGKIVETMHREIYSNLSLAEIAEENFMSVSYVKVLFERYAGVSPKSYYINLRLNEIVRMLSEGMAVREISEKMNFSSPNYFSAFFKAHMKMTPIQFRNLSK
ncbi:MAG: helix-turn-helix transcriptional regulator [Clostridia bacterium]|nr:helix-turn-helix transcriptional regulator [Clostridia bacterium]